MDKSNQKRLFITGTDTEVGKTFFTCSLIKALKSQSKTVMAFKPVAAGCESDGDAKKNEDALQIIEALEFNGDYPIINPIALTQPIAPHIAAQQENVNLSVSAIQKQCRLEPFGESVLLVEGAGGWLVPLNAKETFADYVKEEHLDVILVVGLKLGCINHALLTRQAIESAGLKLVGWVANHIDPQMLEQKENIESLKARMGCPLIAEIPFIADSLGANNATDIASEYVRIETIL